MGQPLFHLGVSCLFHLRDFCFHCFYKLRELFLAFLSCLGVHIPRDAFAVDYLSEPPLVEVVIYHGDAPRATLAYLPPVGFKFLLRRGFRGGGFTCLGRFRALRELGNFSICTADFAVDLDRRLKLHRCQ